MSSSVFPELKEDSVDPSLTFQHIVEKEQFMSCTPVITTRVTSLSSALTCGYHNFHVWIPPAPTSGSRSRGCSYRVTNLDKFPKLFVQRGRRWPLSLSLHPSLTPYEFRVRVTPRFVDDERSIHPVESCNKHSTQSDGLKGRSLIAVLSPRAEYVMGSTLSDVPAEQISVVFPLNVLELVHRSERKPLQDSSQSTLLPQVEYTVQCRINCFNSCFGLNQFGEVDLVLTLERRESTDSQSPYIILGLQKVRIRCCSCPSRDSRVSLPSVLTEHASHKSSPADDARSSLARRSSRRLSLNVPPRLENHKSPTNTGSCQEVTIDGENYKLLLLTDQEQWEHFRFARNIFVSTSSSVKPYLARRPKRVARMFDRLERCVSKRLRSEVLTCSQDSSCSSNSSSQSSQADKAIQTDPLDLPVGFLPGGRENRFPC
ncbi:unnamed protein product [Dicrocoelium dendriticum]|nr:unnamed protein product [Dicrocoelium dendriticum]